MEPAILKLFANDPEVAFWTPIVFGAAASITLFLHLPDWVALVRATLLCRLLEAAGDSERGAEDRERQRASIDAAFAASPQADAWARFQRERTGMQSAALEDRTPMRFGEVLQSRPLLAPGIRRSLIAELPRACAVLGVLTALVTLQRNADTPEASLYPVALLSLALPALSWALGLTLVTALAQRSIVGAAEGLAARLDRLIGVVFPSPSRAECETRRARTKRLALDRLTMQLAQTRRELRSAAARVEAGKSGQSSGTAPCRPEVAAEAEPAQSEPPAASTAHPVDDSRPRILAPGLGFAGLLSRYRRDEPAGDAAPDGQPAVQAAKEVPSAAEPAALPRIIRRPEPAARQPRPARPPSDLLRRRRASLTVERALAPPDTPSSRRARALDDFFGEA